MLFQRLFSTSFIAQLVLSGAILFDGVIVSAQTPPALGSKPTPSVLSRPLWTDLADSQQQALAPLAQLWPTMTEPHKRKWLAISQNFGQLTAEEQVTVQGRMREWAALSPQQRTAARLNYADAKQLLQDDKKAKWEAYQALSPEAKNKLATQQSQPIQGAAPAIKPVPAAKLTPSPVASGNKPLPRIATDQVAPTTLLPNPITSTAPTSVSTESTVTPQ
jgi:hypothetical protein